MIKELFTHTFMSLTLVVRNTLHIIVYPYKTMRNVVQEKDYYQIAIIFLFIWGYFGYAGIIRNQTQHPFLFFPSVLMSCVVFIVTFMLTTGYFYGISRKISPKTSFSSLVFGFAYSLFPTFLWFIVTSTLFYLLPPPRTISPLGQIFSIVFVIFSITLLLWRIILLYLTLRFTFKKQFYSLAVAIASFLLLFLPYSYALYKLGIARIPFI